MNRFSRFAPFALLAVAVILFAAGCKSKTADNGQNAVQDSSADPASANLAPVSTDTGAQSSAPAAAAPSASPSDAAAPQSAPPPPTDAGSASGSYDQASGGTVDDADYGEQPAYTAQQPPPELPDYQQPPAPGDGYEWTPGYWGYASAGYYWVPGVWVQAPYEGALWTPGYWGSTGGHYGFFRGYWGRHIGFYGGVNYGYGYVGTGYLGGYWHGSNFFYNRTVNNINVTVIHNVYEYPVHVNNAVRVSYNGPGGIAQRARPAELAAIREPHAAPMRAQLENQHAASVNRAQFVSVNHGRPATAVVERPLAADRDVHPVALPASRMEAARPEARPAEASARANEPSRPAAARPEPAPRAEQRPAPAARPESHPAPAARPAPAPRAEQRPAPGAKPESHPAPAARPAPAPRAEQRPAPAARPAPAHPAPAAHPAPKPEQPKHDDEHPR